MALAIECKYLSFKFNWLNKFLLELAPPLPEKTQVKHVLSRNYSHTAGYHVRMASQIDIYKDMSSLSAQMVTAAHAHDWELLIRLEKSVAALRNKLPRVDDNATLSPDELAIKRDLIQGILENDAAVRTCTEPWMEQLRGFLGNSNKRRRARQAYEAES